jgi:hypothetical protein
LDFFYDHAARNWGHHARAASTGVEEFILDLLKSEAKVFRASSAIMSPRSYSSYGDDVQSHMNGVHLAAHFGLKQAIISLLHHGHDPDSEDIEGRTPLSRAAEYGHDAVVELLLSNGSVDPNSKDSDGRTPLNWAVRHERITAVKLLLAKYGIDVNSQDKKYGQTPLL